MARGDRHGKTKLTEQQIEEIMSLKGTAIPRKVAEQFRVSRSYVRQLWEAGFVQVNSSSVMKEGDMILPGVWPNEVWRLEDGGKS